MGACFDTFDSAVVVLLWEVHCTEDELNGVEDRVRGLALEWSDDGLLLAALVVEALSVFTQDPKSHASGCRAEVSEQVRDASTRGRRLKTTMTDHPTDPLELNLEELLNECTFLEPHIRAEVTTFVLTMNDEAEDGNVRLAKLILPAMAAMRAKPADHVGIALHHIAEELARRILLVIA